MHYIGRFAPSPTGPLHFGSLLAATASYLESRSNQGLWLLRIEDLDKFRERPGSSEQIIQTLHDHGFEWDVDIIYQTTRLPAYQEALQQLAAKKLTYHCTCTRKQLIASVEPGLYGRIYPGHCKGKIEAPAGRHAIRLQVPDQDICFDDAIQGKYCQNLASELGDFIVLRSDKVFAYQLAVVIDDEWQGITHIVRGADLLDNTPRQIYIQQSLGIASPQYMHIPMANNALGQKLSKQTHAPALKKEEAIQNLCQVMQFLGHTPPAASELASVREFWDWAIPNWNPALVATTNALPYCPEQ